MIKCEVVFDGDSIDLNGHYLMVGCTENGSWYVEIDGNNHDKTLEQAIAYCMEQSN